jgi:hypothetical protein
VPCQVTVWCDINCPFVACNKNNKNARYMHYNNGCK